jgi:hypothetical protein
MLSSVLIWLIGAMAIGFLFVILGWRGRRLNAHPVCRQCAFDLSGCPDGTITCPECGAGLKRSGAIRIGQRRRMPLVMTLGGLLIAFPAAAIATTAAAMLTGTDLNTYKPIGILLWEARRSDAARSAAIATELLSRYTAKKIGEQQVKTVMTAALNYQGDISRPWATEWGDLIEAGISDSKLTEDEQARFRAQAAVLEWKIRPRVNKDDPIPVIGTVKETRIGSTSMLMGMVWHASAAIGEQKLSRASRKQGILGLMTPGSPQLGWIQLHGTKSRMGVAGASGDIKLLLDSQGIRLGRHVINLAVTMETKSQAMMQTIHWNQKGEAPDSRRHEATLAFELVESGGIEVVDPSPELQEKMELQFQPMQVWVHTYDTGTFMGSQTSGQVHFSIDGSPMAAAFDVIWKSGEREWPLGRFSTGSSADPELHTTYGVGAQNQRYASSNLTGFDVSKVDVILRPNPAAALCTLDVEKIYGGEIVYKDVEVIDPSRGTTRTGWRVSGSSSSTRSKVEPASDAQSKSRLMKSIYDALTFR